MSQQSFAQRLAPKIGKPVATLVVESGADRHFILEITATAVATYLGGKLLSGFVDGLGITDLGKTLGKAVKEQVIEIGKLLFDDAPALTLELQLDGPIAVLEDAARQLAPYAGNQVARQSAEEAVRQILLDKGVPQSEARRIARAVDAELLGAAPAPPTHG